MSKIPLSPRLLGLIDRATKAQSVIERKRHWTSVLETARKESKPAIEEMAGTRLDLIEVQTESPISTPSAP